MEYKLKYTILRTSVIMNETITGTLLLLDMKTDKAAITEGKRQLKAIKARENNSNLPFKTTCKGEVVKVIEQL